MRRYDDLAYRYAPGDGGRGFSFALDGPYAYWHWRRSGYRRFITFRVLRMESAEQFMSVFFRARTADISRELRDREPFRHTFFAEGCIWDSRRRSVQRSDSEQVVEVSLSAKGAAVITREIYPFPRLRYHLLRLNDKWLIERVEHECSSCARDANADCAFCNGSGWFGDTVRREQPEGSAVEPPRPGRIRRWPRR